MIHQLRIYEVFDHNRDAFHARFEEHAARIMATYGFRIVAAWDVIGDDRSEFVYLLAWPDVQTMRDAWAAFLADQEWAEIKRTTAALHGDLVGRIDDRVLEPTSFSPELLA